MRQFLSDIRNVPWTAFIWLVCIPGIVLVFFTLPAFGVFIISLD